jgi:two-component system, chemotaxis family, sensor kinase Cph1
MVGGMSTIAGRSILVVEDEGIAALALCDTLELAGATVVGPAATVASAEQLAATRAIDAAVLDVDLGGQLSYGVAAQLQQRGVPVVFLTGYTAPSPPPELAGCTTLTKPVTGSEIRDALAAALARRAPGGGA